MEHHLTYDDAVHALEGALKFGIDPSLDPMRTMCEAMGNPQGRYRCVQVAGTNGKTSTTRMIAALLRQQGLRTGLYTSPHLVKYPERIEVDGAVISDELFARGVEAALGAAREAGVEATEFELLTAAALWVFAREGVDWAVLECGLGGRWDATSVVDPDVAVITGVALDHTAILGDTVEQIAAEKAAIIKPGGIAVLADDLAAREVFETRAHEVGAPIYQRALTPLVNVSMLPAYQCQNLATAIAAVTAVLGEEPSQADIEAAIAGLVIPGRFEVLCASPLVIIDAAHNPQSAQVLAGELEHRFVTAADAPDVAAAKRDASLPDVPILLLGVLADKDAHGIIKALCPLFERIVVTASSSPRAIAPPELAALVEEETGRAPEVAASIAKARDLLSDESFVATGSITVAGEVKGIWC